MATSKKSVQSRTEKSRMQNLMAPLPCYARLLAGNLSIEDCALIDQTLAAHVKPKITNIREAWFTVNVQTCKCLVAEWRDEGAKWLGEKLNKTNQRVFEAYYVIKALSTKDKP